MDHRVHIKVDVVEPRASTFRTEWKSTVLVRPVQIRIQSGNPHFKSSCSNSQGGVTDCLQRVGRFSRPCKNVGKEPITCKYSVEQGCRNYFFFVLITPKFASVHERHLFHMDMYCFTLHSQ